MIELALGGAALEGFDGSLDVLVGLVRAGRYPAGQLPVAEICRQFLLYMQEAEQADVELGGEFLHAAAWLVYLKSCALLPQQAGEEPAADLLERELLDYETMRATARLLAERLAEAGLSAGFAHAGSSKLAEIPVPATLTVPLTIMDVIASAHRAVELERARTESPSPLPPPDLYTIEAAIAGIERNMAALEPRRGTSTAGWFAQAAQPEAQVALLLGLLELAARNRVLLHQPLPFGPILLQRAF